MNTAIIKGRLTKDPELRYTQTNKAVASFTVAVDRRFEKGKADFFNCVAWQQAGEFVSKYFRKGDPILVRGAIQFRDWTDKDGNKRISAELIAEEIEFCESKRSSGNPAADFKELPDDEEDLPF